MISIGFCTSRADEEFARLLDLQLAQQVGAVGDRHARALADLERAQHRRR